MAVLDTHLIQDDKLVPTRTPEYGPSAVAMFGGQAVRGSRA